MKSAVIFIFVLLTSTLLASDATDIASDKRVRGSGNVVSKMRRVESFNKIDAHGVFNIYILQGDSESVKIEADDNLHQYILTKVDGNTLSIYTQEDISFGNVTKNNIYITVRDLTEISIGGVCDVFNEGILKANILKIGAHGVSDVDLNISCNHLEVKASGVGDCVFTGNSKTLSIISSGTRDIDARKLPVDKAMISKSGIGDVRVFVNKEIDITSSGTGDIIYYGNPVVKSLNKSGVGEIVNKK